MDRPELLDFLEEKAKVFLREGSMSPRDLLAMVDDQAGLHLPRKPNNLDLAECLIEAAERTPTGVFGLREWLERLPKEQKDELTLEGVAEVLNYQSSLE